MIPLPLAGPGPVAYVNDLSSLARGLFQTLPIAQAESGEPIAVTAAVSLRLVSILRDHRPGFIAIAADTATTVGDEEDPLDARRRRYGRRVEAWEGYKASREPAGPEYDLQIGRLIDIAHGHRIPVYRGDGLEADDWIAALTIKLARLGVRVVIVSKDQDLWQLVRDERVVVWDGTAGSTEAVTAADVEAAYGVPPGWVPAVLALAGDKDEAPGLPGIGEKTAAELIRKYVPADGAPLDAAGALERVLSRWQWETTAKGQPSKVGRSLRDGGPLARLSLELVELREDRAPLRLDLAEMRVGWTESDAARVRQIGEELDIAILRHCGPSPKRPIGERLLAKWIETEAAEEARGA